MWRLETLFSMPIKTIAIKLANKRDGDFHDRIELLLSQRGTSKVWLANELNLSRQALNYILNSKASEKYITEIAKLFDVYPEWLKTGRGKMKLPIAGNEFKIDVFDEKYLSTPSDKISPVSHLISNVFFVSYQERMIAA